MFNNISTAFEQSICFSGSGHHYPWQVGVALYLQENYDLSNISFFGDFGRFNCSTSTGVECVDD